MSKVSSRFQKINNIFRAFVNKQDHSGIFCNEILLKWHYFASKKHPSRNNCVPSVRFLLDWNMLRATRFLTQNRGNNTNKISINNSCSTIISSSHPSITIEIFLHHKLIKITFSSHPSVTMKFHNLSNQPTNQLKNLKIWQ